MFEETFKFLKRHSSYIITTHDKVDADGVGAEIAFAQICREMGRNYRILNSGPVPDRFAFMDPNKEIGIWGKTQGQSDSVYGKFGGTDYCSINPASAEVSGHNSALVILDSADEYNIGDINEYIPQAAEVFIIDHHEEEQTSFGGLRDASASSTCEMIVEMAMAAGILLDPVSAAALYAGIIYDTGSFAYSKTTARTFNAALKLVERGANPYRIYSALNESASTGSLLLHKQVLSTLEIYSKGRIAVQILRKEALESTKTHDEDAEAFVNVPLKASEIEVSILIKESREGQIRCSLRSKGRVNVSKVAQGFGGGGHVTASGFRSSMGVNETLSKVLEKITAILDKD